MSKLTTRQKVALFVCLGIVANILTIGGIGFFYYMIFAYADYGKMYNLYAAADDSDYEYFNMTVSHVIRNEGADSAYIYVDSIDTEDFYSRYADKYTKDTVKTNLPYYFGALQVQGQSYLILLESGFFEKAEQDGVVLTVYSHPEYWWHEWDCPLIAVSIGDEVYLDFETGKQNWLDWLKFKSEDYGFLQTPIKERGVV
ncbi:MAG: hypothetical protein J1F65_05405 [Clostridiales bacterium]|nr:hypothetical protein [Clostridiales bacterium]